jgi:cytochrome P450
MPNIDLNSRANQNNPFPTYAVLRDNYPVCRLNSGMYALSRYGDINMALHTPELFSEGASAPARAEWLPEDCKREIFLLSKSPPEHGKYRVLVNRAFIGTAIKNFIPIMQRKAESLIATLPSGEPVDFLKHFAYPYSSAISCLAMGLDGDLYEKYADAIRRWSYLSELNTPDAPLAHRNEIIETTRALNKIYDEIFLERRTRSREDLFTALLSAEVDGIPLTEQQVRGALDLLLAAGFNTTAQFLASAMIELAQQTKLRQTLTSNPELIPHFIEELLRFNGPTQSVMRTTTRAVTLHGVTIPERSFVQLLIASANRDDRQFDRPEQFIMDRPNIKTHVAFGHGVHVCLGAALVRLEVKIALEAFLCRFSAIQCPPAQQLEWNSTLFSRGVTALPAIFE